jgi:hypothetical protein
MEVSGDDGIAVAAVLELELGEGVPATSTHDEMNTVATSAEARTALFTMPP